MHLARSRAETLERFQVNWNRSQAATAARRPSGAPAQARTLGSAAVSDKTLEAGRFMEAGAGEEG